MSMYRWLFRKATEILGEEEVESLKNDLINPVKIAARDAAADILGDIKEKPDGESEE